MQNRKERAIALLAANGFVAAQTFVFLKDLAPFDMRGVGVMFFPLLGCFSAYYALAHTNDDGDFQFWERSSALTFVVMAALFVWAGTFWDFTPAETSVPPPAPASAPIAGDSVPAHRE